MKDKKTFDFKLRSHFWCFLCNDKRKTLTDSLKKLTHLEKVQTLACIQKVCCLSQPSSRELKINLFGVGVI